MSELPHHLKRDIDDADFQVEESPDRIKPHHAIARFTVEPQSIPLQTLQYVALSQPFFEEFRAIFDRNSVSLPQDVKAPEGALTTDALIHHQLFSSDRVALFSGGYINLGQDIIVPIRNVGFNSETLVAEVFGTTRQAETVCKKLGELLWRVTGTDRRWSELSEFVQIASHTTTTRVDLGFGFSKLYSAGMRSFIKDCIEGGESLGKEMGLIGQRSPEARDDFIVTTAFETVDLKVAIYDKVSGEHEVTAIRIAWDTRKDINRNLTKITSELPFERHVVMVNQLIQRISNEK